MKELTLGMWRKLEQVNKERSFIIGERDQRDEKDVEREIKKEREKRFKISKYKKIRVWTLPLAIYFT